MKVINFSFGYCKMQLQNGQAAYVASEDIKLASVELAPATTVDHDSATAGEHVCLNSREPRLIAPPEPLPETSATSDFGY